MSDWPSLGRVDDHRLADSLRSGEPEALAHIFDVYGARLYDYCHALVRDRSAAADAVNDALIAAHSHITRLSNAERFRGWLYAIARNEALRKLRGPELDRPRQEAPETVDLMLDPEARTMLQDTRQLVHNALTGLTAQEREAIDLALRHELEVEDVAGVLTLPGERAYQLIEGARNELDNTLAASIVARTGRGECPTVASLVDTWDGGPLSPLVRKKLVRHIDSCPTCADRRERKVATGKLLQSLPVAALPQELRPRVMSAANAPELAADRATIAQRAEPFDAWGWPSPLDRGKRQRQRPVHRAKDTGADTETETDKPTRLWPAIAAAAAVVLLVGGIFFVLPGSGDEDGPPQAVPSPGEQPSSVEVSPTEELPSVTPEETTASPTPEPTTSAPRPRPRPTRPSPTKTRPKPGRLSVAGCSAGAQETSCQITVTAVGGTVRWSVTGTGENVSAAGGGTLTAGRSDTVTVTIDKTPCVPDSSTVSFSPGGSASVSWECP